MKHIEPDIFVNIYFYPAEKGGKNYIIPAVQFSCPIIFNEKKFDCRLFFNQINKSAIPGHFLEKIPIKFLCPQNIKNNLEIGDKFFLWDMKIFAEGVVIEVL